MKNKTKLAAIEFLLFHQIGPYSFSFFPGLSKYAGPRSVSLQVKISLSLAISTDEAVVCAVNKDRGKPLYVLDWPR